MDQQPSSSNEVNSQPVISKGPFNKDDQTEIENLYKNLTKLLDKAGLNEKCTPAVLRAKCANDMGYGSGGLDGCEAIISKMIIRWWKSKGEEQLKKKTEQAAKEKDKVEKAAKAAAISAAATSAKGTGKQEKGSAPSSSSAQTKEIYQKLRTLAKEIEKVKLLEGISDLPDTDTKVKKLRKRFIDANMILSDPPTDQELQRIRDAHKRTQEDSAGKRKNPDDPESQSEKKAKIEEQSKPEH